MKKTCPILKDFVLSQNIITIKKMVSRHLKILSHFQNILYDH